MKIAGTVTTWGILGVLKVSILFLRCSSAADINQFIALDMEVWVFLSSTGTTDSTSATLMHISI